MTITNYYVTVVSTLFVNAASTFNLRYSILTYQLVVALLIEVVVLNLKGAFFKPSHLTLGFSLIEGRGTGHPQNHSPEAPQTPPATTVTILLWEVLQESEGQKKKVAPAVVVFAHPEPAEPADL